MAIEEIILRKSALHAELGLCEQGSCTFHRLGLAYCPETNRIGPALAAHIVIIDVMMLLKRTEQIELEGNARVSRRHHRMGDELSGLGRTIMAIKADIRA